MDPAYISQRSPRARKEDLAEEYLPRVCLYPFSRFFRRRIFGTILGLQNCFAHPNHGKLQLGSAGADHKRDRKSVGQFDETLNYINRVQKASTVEQVCAELLSVTSQFGLTALLAGTVPDPNTPLDEQKRHVLLCDWPIGWLERYVERNYVDSDPVVCRMKRSPSSFQWEEANRLAAGNPTSRDVIGDAGTFDLNDGYAFPLITLDGTCVMVSLGGPAFTISDENFSMLSLVSTYAIGRAMQLCTAADYEGRQHPLTSRETECLKWAAVGKSEWEISQILGISEHTSEKHLLNAKAKLGASNRVQAVAEAIRLGYIN